MKISSSSILILCPQYNFLMTFFEGKNFRLRTFSVIFQFWKEREYVGAREMCCNVKDIVINTVLPLCPEPSFVERVTHVVHLDCVLCKSIPFRWDKEEHGDVGEYCVDCVATHTLFCFVQISFFFSLGASDRMCKHVSLPFIVSFRPVFAIVRERMMLKRILILGDNIVNYEGFG